MNKEIVLPYGHDSATIEIPESNLAWIDGPKQVPPLPDLAGAVRQALRNPIGSPSLAELVTRHGRRTMILVDDGTRSTPQTLILPILLDELASAGVGASDICIMVALGTHRAMGRDELIKRVGKDVFDRVQVVNLSQKPEDFADLGVTPLGIPIHVSRRYLDSDLKIAVGNIIPHMYAGWAGGAKMVQPGVTSAVTTGRTHLIAGPLVYETLGNVDNPVRREMEEIAVRSGLKFILNVVLNASSEVVAVVAGDTIQALRAGIEIARPIYTINVAERPDIVVASSHPADRDLWQGFKPVNNCGMVVKDGGTLILLIPAPEGIAPDHQQLVDFGTTSSEEVQRLVREGKVADEVAAATYLAFDRTRRRINVILVSDGITDAEARRIGITATRSFREALDTALARHGASARIGVVTAGADVMAQLPGS
ncbi:MAG: nickel-dependent lactate racemase [Bryobacteraceae bacterium]